MEIILGGIIFVLAMFGVCTIVKAIKEKIHMVWFTKKKEDKVIEAIEKNGCHEEASKPKDEWIWVTGYKATDSDMMCRGYQYTMGERHNMPDDAEIVECQSGFHLCLCLEDVFKYYDIGEGNRFFRVSALVRKSDYDEYGHETKEYKAWKESSRLSFFPPYNVFQTKLVSRSIIFERELTPDEILEGRIDDEWTDKYKKLALEIGIENARNHMFTDDLTALGYSYPFAQHIIASDKYDLAKVVASQPDLSMDMKCWMIFK